MSESVNNSLYFYKGSKLVTVKQGKHHRAIFRSAEMPLAEQHMGEISGNALLATDYKGSVLQVQSESDEAAHSYSAYGHAPTLSPRHHSLGFNGERIEQLALGYLLGNGYRLYCPVLMRFLSPDNHSPFNVGGINAYGYCEGDPLNFSDPSGHVRSIIANLKNISYVEIEIDHRPLTSATASERMTRPGNTKNYQLDPKTPLTTFHREKLHIFAGDKPKRYILEHHLSEYLINDVELKQLTSPLRTDGPKPDLPARVMQDITNEVRSRVRRNEKILKMGEAIYAKALDPNMQGINIRGFYRGTSHTTR